MFTKKQKRSSRKNMASRRLKRHFNMMQSTILSANSKATPVVSKSHQGSTLKRASGRGN